jgi:hypothetical protein
MKSEPPAGIPGWRQSPCLGCDEQIAANRDAHVVVIGKRDGSVLLIADGEPQRLFVAAGQPAINMQLDVLGAAHRDCSQMASWRLQTRTVRLPERLPAGIMEPEDMELEQLGLPPRSGHCPFCATTEDMTDEDIWGRWISKHLRKRFGSFRFHTPEGYREYQRVPWVAPVCRTCNNRWMSVLEKDVQPTLLPMILGPQPGVPSRRTLSPSQQEMLATWAVKTALMIDFSGLASPVIPIGYYQQFRMYRKALPNMLVWVAGYCGSQRGAFAAHGGLHLEITPELPPNMFMTLFTAWRVIFKVCGYIGPDFPQNVRYDSEFEPALSRIWPPTGQDIEWPRNGLAFGDDVLMRFASEQPILLGKAA